MRGGLNFRWSSHLYYINQNDKGLTDIKFPNSLFSGNPATVVHRHLDYIGEDEETIGTLKSSESEEGTKDHQPEIPDKKMIRKILSELIEGVSEFNGITITELTSTSRIRSLTDL